MNTYYSASYKFNTTAIGWWSDLGDFDTKQAAIDACEEFLANSASVGFHGYVCKVVQLKKDRPGHYKKVWTSGSRSLF